MLSEALCAALLSWVFPSLQFLHSQTCFPGRTCLLLCCGKAKGGFLSHLWGRPEFLHFDKSLFAFLVWPYALPVSSHVLLLLSAGEGTLSPAMSLQHLAHRVSSLQQDPKPLQWPQILYWADGISALPFPRKIPHPTHRVAYGHLRWDSGGAEVTPLLSKMRCKADCSSSCLPALHHSVGPPGFSPETLMWALCFTPAKPNNVGISVVLSFLSLNHLYEYFKSHSGMG